MILGKQSMLSTVDIGCNSGFIPISCIFGNLDARLRTSSEAYSACEATNKDLTSYELLSVL